MAMEAMPSWHFPWRNALQALMMEVQALMMEMQTLMMEMQALMMLYRLWWWRCRLLWCSIGSDDGDSGSDDGDADSDDDDAGSDDGDAGSDDGDAGSDDGDAVLLSQRAELSLKAAPHKQIHQGCTSSLNSCPVESCSSFSVRKTRAFVIWPHPTCLFYLLPLVFSLPQYLGSCSLWILENFLCFSPLHICTHCSFKHSLALLLRMANSWSFKCPLKHDFFT